MNSVERRVMDSRGEAPERLLHMHACVTDIPAPTTDHCVQPETLQLPLTEKEYDFTLLFLSFLNLGIWPDA